MSLCSGATFNKEHITGMMAVLVRLMLCITKRDFLQDGYKQFRKTEPTIDLQAIKILLNFINETNLRASVFRNVVEVRLDWKLLKNGTQFLPDVCRTGSCTRDYR